MAETRVAKTRTTRANTVKRSKSVSKAAGQKSVADPPKVSKTAARIVSSRQTYKGKVFSVYTEDVIEPNGVRAVRDVVRHNGSVVIFAVDEQTNPDDPLVVVERQYRHAAGQYLLELPAGRVEPGERMLAAAKRELMEETGYRAKKWTRLLRYYASPGFVGEWMEIYVASGIVAGKAQPEEDEKIELRLLQLSQLMKMVTSGEIHDGKTIIGTMLYAAGRGR